MKAIVLGSFFLYTTAFVVIQQLVGRRVHAGNISRANYPRFELFRFVAMSLVLIGLLTMSNLEKPSFMAIRWMGIVICVGGLVLSMTAQYHLGKYWVGGVALHKRHQLICTGPYRYVRHPLYSGMIVSAIGLCLVTLNVFYGAGCLLFAGAYALRIPYEDHLLEKKFKKRFQAYAQSTGAIVPRFRKRG